MLNIHIESNRMKRIKKQTRSRDGTEKKKKKNDTVYSPLFFERKKKSASSFSVSREQRW